MQELYKANIEVFHAGHNNMAATRGSNGTSKDLGDNDSQASEPSSYPTFTPSSTVDERQPWTTSSFSRASSNHDRRQPSYSDISEPTLQNRRSVDSAQIQPLSTPPVTGPQGIADDVAFDPQELLQEGLTAWHDRALSLRTLKKSSSIAAARGNRGLQPYRSFKFDRQQSARRSHESYEGTEESMEAVQGSSKSGYSAGKNHSIFKFRIKLKGSPLTLALL
jgi:hypothetical protein